MSTYAIYPSLVDRTVFITGGATGIGASLVEQFVSQGSRVGFVDIDDAAGHALAKAFDSARSRPLFVPTDLTDIAALDAALNAVRSRFGAITVLINNAASDTRHS